MEEIPQDWMTLFPKATIENIEKIVAKSGSSHWSYRKSNFSFGNIF